MYVLIDECLPNKLKRSITGHDVKSLHDMGWAGLKNGELIEHIEKARFDFFITIDASIQYQQHLSDKPFGVIILKAKNNTYEELNILVPKILATLTPNHLRKVTTLKTGTEG